MEGKVEGSLRGWVGAQEDSGLRRPFPASALGTVVRGMKAAHVLFQLSCGSRRSCAG